INFFLIFLIVISLFTSPTFYFYTIYLLKKKKLKFEINIYSVIFTAMKMKAVQINSAPTTCITRVTNSNGILFKPVVKIFMRVGIPKKIIVINTVAKINEKNISKLFFFKFLIDLSIFFSSFLFFF
ncbi:hypothetical protein LCGC14_2639310, partial [marine sediment metagenome]